MWIKVLFIRKEQTLAIAFVICISVVALHSSIVYLFLIRRLVERLHLLQCLILILLLRLLLMLMLLRILLHLAQTTTRICAATMLTILVWNGGNQLGHKGVVDFWISTVALIIEHAKNAEDSLAFLVSLYQHTQRTKRLSLVSYLIDDIVKGRQVARLCHISEDFFFSYTHVDFIEVLSLEELHQDTWICCPANKNVDLMRIIA